MADNAKNSTESPKTINLGRLPVFVGEWQENFNGGYGYHLYNRVIYAGSEFINEVEGNKNTPATIVTADDGRWTSWSINDGWQITANAIDGSIYLTQCGEYVQNISHKATISLTGLTDHANGMDYAKYGCGFCGHTYTAAYDMNISTYGSGAEMSDGYPKYYEDKEYTKKIERTRTVTDNTTTYGQAKPKMGDILLGKAGDAIYHVLPFYNEIIYGIGSDAQCVATNGSRYSVPSSTATGKTYRATNNTGSKNKFYLLCPSGTHGVTFPTKLTMNGFGLESTTENITYNNIKYNVIETKANIGAGNIVAIYAQ